jgi:hypothetical protein
LVKSRTALSGLPKFPASSKCLANNSGASLGANPLSAYPIFGGRIYPNYPARNYLTFWLIRPIIRGCTGSNSLKSLVEF